MPRSGPRRPLLAARIDEPDMKWIEEQCKSEGDTFPGFVRRMVAFAHAHMPAGWSPPEE